MSGYDTSCHFGATGNFGAIDAKGTSINRADQARFVNTHPRLVSARTPRLILKLNQIRSRSLDVPALPSAGILRDESESEETRALLHNTVRCIRLAAIAPAPKFEQTRSQPRPEGRR